MSDIIQWLNLFTALDTRSAVQSTEALVAQTGALLAEEGRTREHDNALLNQLVEIYAKARQSIGAGRNWDALLSLLFAKRTYPEAFSRAHDAMVKLKMTEVDEKIGLAIDQLLTGPNAQKAIEDELEQLLANLKEQGSQNLAPFGQKLAMVTKKVGQNYKSMDRPAKIAAISGVINEFDEIESHIEAVIGELLRSASALTALFDPATEVLIGGQAKTWRELKDCVLLRAEFDPGTFSLQVKSESTSILEQLEESRARLKRIRSPLVEEQKRSDSEIQRKNRLRGGVAFIALTLAILAGGVVVHQISLAILLVCLMVIGVTLRRYNSL